MQEDQHQENDETRSGQPDGEPDDPARVPPHQERLAIDLITARVQRIASCAASAARLTRSETVAPILTICTGLARPISSGPTPAPPPSNGSSLALMLALCNSGMTRMLAGPVSRQNG